MKYRPIVTPALALVALIAVSFVAAGYYDFQTRRSQKAHAETRELLAEVRQLQLATRLFRTDTQTLDQCHAQWEQARSGFLAHFQQVVASLESEGLPVYRLRRLTQTIRQAEEMRSQLMPDYEILRGSAFGGQLGSSGMAATYERMLSSREVQGRDLALLGLCLLRLEEYQQGIQLAEADLQYLASEYNKLSQRRVWYMRLAMLVGLAMALAGAALMLRRMLALHDSLARELAARSQAEAKARAGETDIRCMLDSIADAVVSTDDKGLVTRMNPVAERLMGWEEKEAVGLAMGRLFSAVNEITGAPVSSPAERALSEGKVSLWEGNLRLCSRSGVERLISIASAPIRGVQGELRGAVVVFRDITEQNRIEARIRNDASTDSAAKLASGVAHEINNVLQIIRSNLSFALDPRSTAAESKECLTQIDTATRRAADLTRKLLIFSRKHPMRLSETGLARFLETLVPTLRRLLGDKIELELLLGEALPPVRLDQRLMEMAFCNLCENARDAMPSGGRLSIETSLIQFGAEDLDAYPWARSGHFVQIAVADTGRGMDEATLRRICEPFFTTKSLAMATGMGLSVVQGIVLQHDGLLNVFSEENRGTTFRLFLPVQAPPSASEKAAASLSGISSRRILLADDDAHLRGMLATMLRRWGHEVRIASDGDDACSLALDPANHFDVLVLDVVMPRMSGIDAARSIAALRPGVRVILCTGHGRGPLREQVQLECSWRLLTKPVTPERLLREIEALCEPGAQGRPASHE